MAEATWWFWTELWFRSRVRMGIRLPPGLAGYLRRTHARHATHKPRWINGRLRQRRKTFPPSAPRPHTGH